MRWGSIWPGFGSRRRIRRDIGGNNSPGREHTQAPLYRPLISNLRAQALRQSSPRELRMHKRQREMELGPSSLFFCLPKVWGLQKYETVFFSPSVSVPYSLPFPFLSPQPPALSVNQMTWKQQIIWAGDGKWLDFVWFWIIRSETSNTVCRKWCKQVSLIGNDIYCSH